MRARQAAIDGDADALYQAALNVVLNAIDATAKGGRIELTVERHPYELEVQVRDDGAGIAPEHEGRIFQPYFTTKRHGTGLGLFVTRKLVLDHGGTVDYVSRPGMGTVFQIRLPLNGQGA